MWRLALIGLVGCGGGELQQPPPRAEGPEDLDGDGYEAGQDCDDTLDSVHPGAAEVPYDGIDQDCSGLDLADVDGDGHDALAAGGGDCDDRDPAIHPDADEVPYDDLDQDCSGADLADLDEDGFDLGADCDDQDPAVHPDAAEIWYDGVDQDCRGDCDYDADRDNAVPVEWEAEIADGSACDRDPGGGVRVVPDCDDADPEADTQRIESIWPADGSADVDPGAQVEVYLRDVEPDVELHLFGPGGAEVTGTTIVEVGSSLGLILIPDRPLAGGSVHTVEIVHSCGTEGASFTTS